MIEVDADYLFTLAGLHPNDPLPKDVPFLGGVPVKHKAKPARWEKEMCCFCSYSRSNKKARVQLTSEMKFCTVECARKWTSACKAWIKNDLREVERRKAQLRSVEISLRHVV